MSSKGKSAASHRQAHLCRLGERVVVSPGAGVDPAGERIVSRAIRHMDIAAGDTGFRIHQFTSAADFEAELAGTDLLDIHAFLDRFLPAFSGRMLFLKGIFDVAARMLRLQGDAVFIQVARALVDAEGLPVASIHLDLIDGYDTAIATVPARARFQRDDIFVSLAADALAIGRIEHAVDHLARENSRQKLATISFSGLPAAGQGLLVGASGLVRVNAEAQAFPSLDAFHAAYARSNADRIALMLQADEEAAPQLNLLARRKPPTAEVDDPLLGFRFVIDAAIPLENGLFASGWFYDPEDLIAAVIAVDHSLEETEVSALWKLFDGRAEIAGKIRPAKRFAAFLPRGAAAVLPTVVPLRVMLKNGENHLLTAAPVPQDLTGKRERILECIAPHAFEPDMLEEVFGPALAPIQDALNARQAVRDVKEFGVRSDRRVSFIIPLYKETGFIRSQLMAFSVDPFVKAHCELVYVLDDPLIALEVASQIEGSAFAYPLDLKLVTLDRNGGYALANNMGVSEADGDVLVLMNSDVIPVRSGWLETALERLEALPAFSVIGPKLLYADESLQHAGMYFHRLSTGYWQNFHYWKGYARHFTPAMSERIVPAVTGACMIIRKPDYLDVGGFTTDYIVGDYEDSDLCLKLRDKHGVPLYMPAIELYHFERQSMPDETDQRDHGSTVYNRALQTTRWGVRIDEANASAAEFTHAE